MLKSSEDPPNPIQHWQTIQNRKIELSARITGNLTKLDRLLQIISDCPQWLKPIATFLLNPAIKQTEKRMEEYREIQRQTQAIEREARKFVAERMGLFGE